jgi:hypothetical protein
MVALLAQSRAQVDAAKQKKQQSLHDLLRQGEIWEVS